MRYIWIDGVPYLWRDLVRQRREQCEAGKKKQLALFEMKDDARPLSQRTADGRYSEPTLFDDLRRTSCDTATACAGEGATLKNGLSAPARQSGRT